MQNEDTDKSTESPDPSQKLASPIHDLDPHEGASQVAHGEGRKNASTPGIAFTE